MKKILILILLVLLSTSLSSCSEKESSNKSSSDIISSVSSSESSTQYTESSKSTVEKKDNFTILGINDTHGQLTDQSDFAKTAGYVREEKDENDALFISQGDQFQGSAISNLSTGAIFVDALNAAGLDSLTVGNHEFDWGIDEIQRFRDGNLDNGEANFPILLANVVSKSTNSLIENFDPYTVLETNGYKVGVIGMIGKDTYGSILPANVIEYNFLDEKTTYLKYEKELREKEHVDFVIVSIHYGSTIMSTFDSLSADVAPDAIFLGHTHKKEQGTSSTGIPYVQGQANGTYISKIKFNVKDDEVFSFNIDNISTLSLSNSPLIDVTNAINIGVKKYSSVINEKLTYFTGSNSNFRNEIGQYSTKLVVDVFAESLGLVYFSVNSGGFRSSPDSNSDFTYGKLYEIIPFDNTVTIAKVSGATLKGMISSNSTLKYNNPYYCSLDISDVIDSEIYTVGAISYVFQNEPIFMGADYIYDTNFVFREILKEDLVLHETWNPNTSIGMLTEYSGT